MVTEVTETHDATGIEYTRTFTYSTESINTFFKGVSPIELVLLKNAVKKGLILYFTNDTDGSHAYFATATIGNEITPILGVHYAGCEAQKNTAVLFHELVHFEQWSRGDLRYDQRSDQSYWKESLIDRDNTAYRDLPQEVEAWDRQYDFLCVTGQLNRHLPRWMNEIVIYKRLGESMNAVRHRVF